ncbi:dienelactone hydrolase family protein [Cytophagales bacterium LB-30]|uniref:Dienelactone hydrolase family protein n=1 Tax=Shiella aurantiaca TaxID=3058365 RepID=A0ABT8F599_9BACT|nr:dienelactone hydrolase family protein [Shiella aurantiaca]MDN4165657.1 dienelactone hydrolase family protein [Shiella aurantiaca]
MIKSFLLTLVLGTLAVFSVSAQHSCCMTTPTAEFAVLAKDQSFTATHQNPLPYTHHSEVGKMIKIPTKGAEANAFELKASSPSDKYLIVIHEWWGLNDHIKKEAEKYYSELGNVHVLAIDLYDGQVATTREDAAKYMQGASEERIREILKGVYNYVGHDAYIATIGWCFGGGWSLQAAMLFGPNTVGCVMYYGMPEKDAERAKMLQSDVLGIFASREKWISPAVVSEFESMMQGIGKKVEIHQFDAEHAFANPSNPAFDAKATAEAYTLSINYLKERLK